jgi:hypothetical protein
MISGVVIMKAFISYSRKDQVKVIPLIEDLKELGNTVWFDQNTSGGQAWWDKVLSEIRACNLFVYCVSPNAVRSKACEAELQYATDLGKRILPVRVEGVSNNVLPRNISSLQYVDYMLGDKSAYQSLTRALHTLQPQSTTTPDRVVPPPPIPISYMDDLARQIDSRADIPFANQSQLVTRLRYNYQDPDTRQDAEELLSRLRRRPDTATTITQQIDEILKFAPPPPESHPILEPSIPLSEKPKKSNTTKIIIIIVLGAVGLWFMCGFLSAFMGY